MRPLLDLAYRIQKRVWRLLRPKTRGVKVMLMDNSGRLLLIRNGYGQTQQFVFAGGGIRPWESPERAAAREVREELGCEVTELQLVSTHFSSAEGKRDTIHLFRARISGEPRIDDFEIIEARFFAPARLPKTVSPATRRRVEEMMGKRETGADW